MTPASWELRQSTNGYWFIDHEQGGESYTLTKLECGERDARLIAAAPELLACLLDVLDADGDLDVMDFNRYRAAVAKATGEQA
jgi:hypothetical protein